MLFLSSADFFSKLTFSKNSFRNTIRVSKDFDSGLERHSVGPDQEMIKVATSRFHCGTLKPM